MKEEVTMQDSLAMIDEINRKAEEFLDTATDEDFKMMFSGCSRIDESGMDAICDSFKQLKGSKVMDMVEQLKQDILRGRL